MSEDYAICISDFEEELNSLFIGGLEFKLTCLACPEQYDVFLDGVQVAYVRLRHGFLRVWVPDCDDDDNLIYTHEFDDGWKGTFDSDEERFDYLYEIAKIIKKKVMQDILDVFKGDDI